jgi:hypothetical protein
MGMLRDAQSGAWLPPPASLGGHFDGWRPTDQQSKVSSVNADNLEDLHARHLWWRLQP